MPPYVIAPSTPLTAHDIYDVQVLKLTFVAVIFRRGKINTEYLFLDKSLRNEVVHDSRNHGIRVRRDRALCKADRPNADDTIHTVETVERKCITDGLVGDNETRCEGHLVEIYRP